MSDAPLARETPRLLLTPLGEADVEDVLRIYGDAQTWQHLPQGRFTSRDEARMHIDNSLRSQREYGLGTWAVRLRAGEQGPADSPIIGIGGVRYLEEPGLWNLGYRFDPRAWGNGYATELAEAALNVVAEISPGVAVTARALVNNPASLAVLDRIGLTMVWEGARSTTDLDGDEPPLIGRAYSDRPLSAAALEWLARNM